MPSDFVPPSSWPWTDLDQTALRVNVYHKDGSVVVEAESPGFPAEHLAVSHSEDTIVIAAHDEEEHDESGDPHCEVTLGTQVDFHHSTTEVVGDVFRVWLPIIWA